MLSVDAAIDRGSVEESDGRTAYADTRGNVAPRARAVRFWKPFRTPDPPTFGTTG